MAQGHSSRMVRPGTALSSQWPWNQRAALSGPGVPLRAEGGREQDSGATSQNCLDEGPYVPLGDLRAAGYSGPRLGA